MKEIQNPQSNIKKQEKPEHKGSSRLIAKIEKAIRGSIPEEQREQIAAKITHVVMASEYFQGPIMPPKHLREYNNILPGAAERIINMAENQQSHEHEMEKTIITRTLQIHRWAMIFGFSAFIILIFIAVTAGMTGNNILAGMLLTTAVLGGATTLIRGRDRITNTDSEE